MKFFPSEHEEIPIFPLSTETELTRLKELSHKKHLKGTFFANIFTLKPKRLTANSMLITGYFSPDSRRLVLDYFLTKTGKVLWLAEIFLLPVLLLALYLYLTSGIMPGDSIFFVPMCVFFYMLWALLIFSIKQILFHSVKKKIHKEIVINSMY